MSEWDDNFSQNPGNEKTKEAKGSWDALLTVFALAATTAVSFLVSWLTRDIGSRPVWMLGGSFAAPAAALMGSVLLKEKIWPAMTPASSRKAQIGLSFCTIAAAAVVGCFCLISNTQLDSIQTVAGEGWSDVLIILDKSGSMDTGLRDKKATEAVTELIRRMDDSAQVGLLIDVGWEENNFGEFCVPLFQRQVQIAPLTATQRNELTKKAEMPTYLNENFPMAFQTACEMLENYTGENGKISILMVSDGEDCTEEFRAADFADRLNEMGVQVNYIYVAPDYSEEVVKLAEKTGGSSFFVENLDELQGQMQKMVSVPVYTTVYKDALRDIQESETAKTVTGILLFLLGGLIGFSLLIMLSVQGQKRFQMILSPVMALLSFLLLAFGSGLIPTPWIREGIAFSLLGVVVMRKNNECGSSRHAARQKPAAPDTLDPDW